MQRNRMRVLSLFANIGLAEAYLKDVGVDTNSMGRIFTLKPIPLADIQSKAANQLKRIGICAVA